MGGTLRGDITTPVLQVKYVLNSICYVEIPEICLNPPYYKKDVALIVLSYIGKLLCFTPTFELQASGAFSIICVVKDETTHGVISERAHAN